jgi:hypothetical protein
VMDGCALSASISTASFAAAFSVTMLLPVS